nr:hypothetical protein [Burkholderia ubonensis]
MRDKLRAGEIESIFQLPFPMPETKDNQSKLLTLSNERVYVAASGPADLRLGRDDRPAATGHGSSRGENGPAATLTMAGYNRRD